MDDSHRSRQSSGHKSSTAAAKADGYQKHRVNTCYFNSVLQSLSHTHAFHQELLVVDDCQGKLRESFIEAVFELTDDHGRPIGIGPYAVSPEDTHRPVFPLRQVADRFFEKVSRFDNDRQHDSHECLRHFLEEIKKEERESKASSPTDRQLTVVDKIFGGHLITVYICKECDKHYHLFEPCLDISLPVFFDAEPRRTSSEETDRPMQSNKENSESMRASQTLRDHDSKEKTGGHASRNQDNSSDQVSSKRNPYKESISQNEPKLPLRETKDCTSDHDRSGVAITRNNYKSSVQKLTEPLTLQHTGHLANYDCADSMREKVSNVSSYSKTAITLYDCFRHFARVEQIHEEYLCEDCLRKAMARGEADENNLKLTSATKKTLIFNPPAILTIHFKRFELLPGRSRKRSDMVEYPEYLDIAPFCSSQCLRNDPPRNNIWYSLYAVVVHSGSLEGGHYLAFVKVREKKTNFEKLKAFFQHKYFNHNVTSDELIGMMNEKKREKSEGCKQPQREEQGSKWYLMNDSSVCGVSVYEVLRQEAYLLFYERVDTEAANITENAQNAGDSTANTCDC